MYDVSTLSGYQFLNQGILVLLTLLYIYCYIQSLVDIVMNYLLEILMYLFYLDSEPVWWQ
jgi:hypothetical protein